MLTGKLRRSTCDTAIYFLQSAAGSITWPVTEPAVAALISALSGAKKDGAAEPLASKEGAGGQMATTEEAAEEAKATGKAAGASTGAVGSAVGSLKSAAAATAATLAAAEQLDQSAGQRKPRISPHKASKRSQQKRAASRGLPNEKGSLKRRLRCLEFGLLPRSRVRTRL